MCSYRKVRSELWAASRSRIGNSSRRRCVFFAPPLRFVRALARTACNCLCFLTAARGFNCGDIDFFHRHHRLKRPFRLLAARRERLMELVRRFSRDHRILVLEDAAYRELRFAGEDIPSIKSFDPENQFVIYTSTFSKPCAPGLSPRCAKSRRECDPNEAAYQGRHRHHYWPGKLAGARACHGAAAPP